MQILCVKNKGYLHFCPLWGFRGGGRFNPHYAIEKILYFLYKSFFYGLKSPIIVLLHYFSTIKMLTEEADLSSQYN